MPVPTVDAIALSDLPLDGSVTQVDTFTLVPGTSKVAVAGQNNPAENYVYSVPPSGAWVRDPTNWPAGSATFPNEFAVREGSNANRGSRWQFDNRAAPSLGVDAVEIVQIGHPRALRPGADMAYDANAHTYDLAGKGIAPGTYERATYNERGLATAVFASGSGSTEFEGLRASWEAAARLGLGAGFAWVPGAAGGAGALVNVADDLDLMGLTLAANAWGYLYLYESGGVGAAELSAQRPATPYLSEARTKGGGTGGVLNNANPDEQPDETRRYLGAVRTHPTLANTVLRFERRGGLVLYQADTTGSPFRTLADGRATSYTTVDLSGIVPPTSSRAWVKLSQGSANTVEFSNSGVTGSYMGTPGVPYAFTTFLELDPLQRFQYRYGAAPAQGNGLTVDVLGYVEEVA